MISIRGVKLYCCDDISLIENYEKAVNDTAQIWICHHKLEIHDDYVNTPKDLEMMGLYFNRPASELIFLTRNEHIRLHNLHKSHDTILKLKTSLKGHSVSEETKKKQSESMKGKKYSNEIIDKRNKSIKEAHNRLGNNFISEEGKERIRRALTGRIPWNKGLKKGGIANV